jgi:hypothetical protein
VPQRDLDKEDHWRAVIGKFLASDLPSKAAFCRAEGIKEKHLTNWQRIIRLRDREQKLAQQRQLREPRAASDVRSRRTAQSPTHARTKSTGTSPAFVPLAVVRDKVVSSDKLSPVVAEVRVGAIVVSIFAGADIETLQVLLTALKEC